MLRVSKSKLARPGADLLEAVVRVAAARESSAMRMTKYGIAIASRSPPG